MPLLVAKDIYHSFGSHPVLDHVNLSIDRGERICLVGRNGSGKSTLLKLLVGHITADEGDIIVSQGVRVAELPQEVPEALDGSLYDVVAEGVGELGNIITQWHHATLQAASDPDALRRMEQLQQRIESENGWNLEQRISSTLSMLKLPAEETFNAQSGGRKRRVLLARALVSQPDLLLLDEPTNHLDIESILWLEEFLKNYEGAILFITHDRAFLQNLATRIIDLDRGQLSSWPGDYRKYLDGKQQQLDAEQTANALFDKKLAQEESWIRQGIKARRTRNEGRVRALKKLREERNQRREQGGKTTLTAQHADASGKIVIEAENLGYSWHQQLIVENFNCKIQRGDKIGIIGPNGCGKSTLIQLLLGEITPDRGTIKHGARLETAYFDQHREVLELEKSVRDNIADGNDRITINGSNRHVIGYLKDFLFAPDQVNTPVKTLSGGERNRLLLARLFTRPSNFLIMDEPTNDLDMDTLELLEEMLLDFPGTLLLVSHDRSFINNLVDYCFVFEGGGRVNEYVGGYDDWLRQRPAPPDTADSAKSTGKAVNARQKAVKRKKLGFNQQKELKTLPRRIEKLEQDLESLQQDMAEPQFYQQQADIISSAQKQLDQLERQLEQLYQRWDELEKLQS